MAFWADPNLDPTSPSFGKLLRDDGQSNLPRQIQLGVRFIFLKGTGRTRSRCAYPEIGAMLTFIQFLEELEQSNRTIVLPAPEVERLVDRFGSKVRSMGRWSHTTDGSVEIPSANITGAVQSLESHVLTEAVRQLKTPEQFTDLLNSSSAAMQLIESLSRLYLRQFEDKIVRFQKCTDIAEANCAGQEILNALFGSKPLISRRRPQSPTRGLKP